MKQAFCIQKKISDSLKQPSALQQRWAAYTYNIDVAC